MTNKPTCEEKDEGFIETEKSFPKGRIKVVLINEDLGF